MLVGVIVYEKKISYLSTLPHPKSRSHPHLVVQLTMGPVLSNASIPLPNHHDHRERTQRLPFQINIAVQQIPVVTFQFPMSFYL
jgi:hypothetical protein